MALQAKCDNCRIKFDFTRDHLLKDSRCPECGGQLKATTYLLKKYRPVFRDPKPYRASRKGR